MIFIRQLNENRNQEETHLTNPIAVQRHLRFLCGGDTAGLAVFNPSIEEERQDGSGHPFLKLYWTLVNVQLTFCVLLPTHEQLYIQILELRNSYLHISSEIWSENENSFTIR